MDSSHILPLVTALLTISVSIFSSIGYYVFNLGQQALQSQWAETTYQNVISLSHNISTNSPLAPDIQNIGSELKNAITTGITTLNNAATGTSYDQLPLSPSDNGNPTSGASPLVPDTNSGPNAQGTESNTTSSTPPTTSPSSTKTAIPSTTSTQPSVTQPVTQSSGGLASPFNTILNDSEDAVVNILCTSQSGNLISVSTGSGVIIDPRGIILTNSHVAQDLLFTDPSQPPVKDCTVRQGHVFSSLYKVSVLYIPLSWAQANKGIDENQIPQGTGQGDYALLAITKSATGGLLPSSFPYISPVTSYRNPLGENVLAIGYPAESIQGSLQARVPEKSALTSIANIFTLDGSGADILQTSPNIVAQRGASGGALVDKNDGLIGLIVSVQNQSISSGVEALEAINTSYIFQNFTSAGVSLSALAADPTTAAQNFAPTGVTIRNLVQ